MLSKKPKKPKKNPAKLEDIELGATYRDVLVDGLQGVATGVGRFITGCDQASLTYMHDGERKVDWLDVTRLELVPKVEVRRLDARSTEDPGCDQPPPARG